MKARMRRTDAMTLLPSANVPGTRIAAGMEFACDTYCFGQTPQNDSARQYVTRIDSVIILDNKDNRTAEALFASFIC